jgi:hypothetical protein
MSRIERQETVRPSRIPVASSRAPLTVKGFDHKNFVGRWVADLEGRIQMFLDAGYEFVQKDEIKKAGEDTVETSRKGLDSRISKPGGRGVQLYLMRTPRTFWEEDRKAKDIEVDRTEEGLKKTSKSSADYGKLTIGSDIKEQG